MASSDMKAVITLTADASGVSTGVNQALGQLQKMQSAISQLRSVALANTLSSIFSGFVSGAMDELNRLGTLGRTFSAEGMGAANNLAIAQQQSDQQLGQAFGPITAAIDQMLVGHLQDLTKYLIENKDAIGLAMAAVAGFTAGIADMTATFLVSIGKIADYFASNSMGTVAADAGGGLAYAAGSITTGNPMGGEAVKYIYDLLRAKIGGT